MSRLLTSWGAILVGAGCAAGPPAVELASVRHQMQAAAGDPTLVNTPVAGGTLTVRVSGVDPSTPVNLYASTNIQGPGAGSCHGGVCLDLARARIAAQGTADANGEATFSLVLPAAPGVWERSIQTIRTLGGVLGASAVVTFAIHERGNLLVLLLDDVGVDQIGLYGIGSEVAPTPTIDALADEGVLFREAYSQPQCSPTRAAILTGRRGWRTGVMHGVFPTDPWALSRDEVLVPEMLDAGTGGVYDHAYLGKWHLNTELDEVLLHPNVHGFAYYAGSLQGVGSGAYVSDGLPQNHFDWERVENGVPARVTQYVDSNHVDTAIEHIAAMSEPWFTMIGLVNAHAPWADPPEDLYTQDPIGNTPEEQSFHRMIEAVDTEVGRLLANIDPDVLSRTTVFLMGDNGTNNDVVGPEFDVDRQKRTVYQGGIHVPLIVAGPLVTDPGRTVDALVELCDLFPTFAEIAGATLDDAVAIDGVSFVPYLVDPASPPLRSTVFAELTDEVGFGPFKFHDESIRDARYKLVHFEDHDELYDLLDVEIEGTDLLADGSDEAEAAIVDGLTAQIPLEE